MPITSKEQKRGNKEARKQKGDKTKPVAIAAIASSLVASFRLFRMLIVGTSMWTVSVPSTAIFQTRNQMC